ncbi:hypothetical protein [Bacillus paranthracis]|uniref:hypothetical protein n=1 Tax=Bacillus paranthracis TaxID=2026186 RepID=UPI0022E03DF7|nr:hypothetical protein [Bacillus paranthracis]
MKVLEFIAMYIERLMFVEVLGFLMALFLYTLDLSLSIHLDWRLPSIDRYMVINLTWGALWTLKHTVDKWEEKHYGKR